MIISTIRLDIKLTGLKSGNISPPRLYPGRLWAPRIYPGVDPELYLRVDYSRSQNLPLPPRIYPLYCDFVKCLWLPESTPPPPRIYPLFQQIYMRDHPRIYPSLPEYPGIYPSLSEYSFSTTIVL